MYLKEGKFSIKMKRMLSFSFGNFITVKHWLKKTASKNEI